MSVQEIVYHFVAGQNPVALPCRVNRTLQTDEQAWQRRLTIGDQWQRLDVGWVERCSLLRVANEGNGPKVHAEAVELGVRIDQGPSLGAVIEVTDVIPAGESVRRLPPNLKCLWLRCRQGRTNVVVVAIPE